MNLSMVTVSLNPDGGLVFATLSMVTVFWNPDGGVSYVCSFVDGDSIFEPRWWGCIYNLLLNLLMVTAFISPDGGVVFTTLFLTAKTWCTWWIISSKSSVNISSAS